LIDFFLFFLFWRERARIRSDHPIRSDPIIRSARFIRFILIFIDIFI